MSSTQQAPQIRIRSLFKRTYVRRRPYPEKKVKQVELLKELLQKYETVLVIDLHETSNRILKEYRFWLRRRGAFVYKAKNNLFLIALQQLLGEVPKEVEKVLRGENLFIFTNENPFELTRWILENGVRREARPGDIAPFDIVIPAGNTGLKPGPIMSRFGRLKVPIRVQEGTIWVARDTLVAKKGDKIDENLAEILRVLKIKPIFEALRVKAAIIKCRRVIWGDELRLDIGAYKSMFEEAVRHAFNLMVNAVYPTPEALRVVIAKAYMEAMSLAVRAGVIAPETIRMIIMRAIAEANALAYVLSQKAPDLGIQVQALTMTQTTSTTEARPAEEKAEEKEEKKEGPSEEDIAAGLGSLFG